MDKRKLKEFAEQEGKFKIYSEQDLIKPISKLLEKQNYKIPLGENFSNMGQVITNNVVEQYFLDFLGIDQKESSVPKIMNHRTGKLYKDYTKEIEYCRLNVPYRRARPLFLEEQKQFDVGEFFKDSVQSDFIYALGDSPEIKWAPNMRVIPMEFFAKYINIKENSKDPEFMFIKYSTEIGSEDGFRNFDKTYLKECSFTKPSLENNIHYAKIKYIHAGDDSFVYVENRKLSIIKKRFFTNLTVNKDYYNNLLFSLSYAYSKPYCGQSPIKVINDKLFNNKFWGGSYSNSFDSIKALAHNPTIFDLIKEYDDDEYLVFDDLDFSYNRLGDMSKSFIVTPDGTYTVNRKRDRTVSLVSPNDKMKLLNSKHDLIRSVSAAVKPAFDSYISEWEERISKAKNLKNWAESECREAPISYLFSSIAKENSIGAENFVKIKSSSIYDVLEQIYGESVKSRTTTYKKPKNSSKLALQADMDEVQMLADHLSSEHDKIYNDFLRNSYAVTLNKLKEAFKFVPQTLKGTKNDYESGIAINLGGDMYLKLLKHIANQSFLKKRRDYQFHRNVFPILNSNILKITKGQSTSAKIKSTLSWLLMTAYELEKTKHSVQMDRSFEDMMGSANNYFTTSEDNFDLSDIDSYQPSEPKKYSIILNYETKQGKYAISDDRLKFVEINDVTKNSDVMREVIRDEGAFQKAHCEPLFEPTQYKLVTKDKKGNVAYSIIRPFIGVDISMSDKTTLISLVPSLPMHNLIFYVPKLNPAEKDLMNRTVFSTYLYSNKTKELIGRDIEYTDPLPICGENANMYESSLDWGNRDITAVTQSTLAFTLRDSLTGSLSTEKHPYIGSLEYIGLPNFSKPWIALFKDRNPSKFFEDYKVPDIRFGKLGGKFEKIKQGGLIKNYFQGTSMEILRIDAWLGLRPADQRNLNLYNPNHWVNQRALFDREFTTYMLMVLVGGAYHLTTIVEAGMDTREMNFETYDDKLYDDTYRPHLRGPYGVAVLNQNFSHRKVDQALTYFSGCFGTTHPLIFERRSSRGWGAFFEINLRSDESNFKNSTVAALMGIRDGKISSYADFVLESFKPALDFKTKKEKKATRNRIQKFIMSQDYEKSVAITASQMLIEHIALGMNSEADILSPVGNLDDEVRQIDGVSDFGSTPLLRIFKNVFSTNLCMDPDLNYSAYEIFKYIKSLVSEQKLAESIECASDFYVDYLKDLYAIKEFGEIDLNNRKVVFPEALRTQADIARYNRKLIRDREELAKFQKGSSKYKVLEYSNAHYAIRMAQSPLELQLEGNALGHCVGTYVNAMTEGRSIIFFLRDKKNPDKPNVTVEFVPYLGSISNVSVSSSYSGYSDLNFHRDNLEFVLKGHINQIQGMSRRPVNVEEALFLNEWRSFAQAQMRKKVEIIPSLGKKKKVKIKHEFIFDASIQNQIDNQLAERPPVA